MDAHQIRRKNRSANEFTTTNILYRPQEDRGVLERLKLGLFYFDKVRFQVLCEAGQSEEDVLLKNLEKAQSEEDTYAIELIKSIESLIKQGTVTLDRKDVNAEYERGRKSTYLNDLANHLHPNDEAKRKRNIALDQLCYDTLTSMPDTDLENVLLGIEQREFANWLVKYHQDHKDNYHEPDAIFGTKDESEINNIIKTRLANPRSRPVGFTREALRAFVPYYEDLSAQEIIAMRKESQDTFDRLRHFTIEGMTEMDNVREGSRIERSFFKEKLDIPVRNLRAEFQSVRDRAISRVVRNTVVTGAAVGAIYPPLRNMTHTAMDVLGEKTNELTEQVVNLTEKLDSVGLANEAAGLREAVGNLAELAGDPNAIAEGAVAVSEGVTDLGQDVYGLQEMISALTAQADHLLITVNQVMQATHLDTAAVVLTAAGLAAVTSIVSGYLDLTSGIRNLKAKSPLFFALKLRVLGDKHMQGRSFIQRAKTKVNEVILGKDDRQRDERQK